MITRRRPYCRDRMCGATDCSNCYGPGVDRDDEEETEGENEAQEDDDDEDEDDGDSVAK